MTNSRSYELVASVIHIDLSAPVMEAARKTGRQGGTPIEVRKISSDTGKKLFGMTLPQEEVILLILTPTSLRVPILKSICETVMKKTGEHAVAISLPVDAVEGLTGRCRQKKPFSFWDESPIINTIKGKQVYRSVHW